MEGYVAGIRKGLFGPYFLLTFEHVYAILPCMIIQIIM